MYLTSDRKRKGIELDSNLGVGSKAKIMVSLPSREKRNKTGIDTLERAIVYSATLLKACYTASNPDLKIDQTVKITHTTGSDNQTFIIIEANLIFDNIGALQDGGRILGNLSVQENIELLETNYYCGKSTLDNPLIFNDLPINITSLEQYFYYHCALLKASLSSEDKSIEIKFLEDANNGGKVQLKISLPFDYSKWLTGSNYVCTVSRLTDSYVDFSTFKNIFSTASEDLGNNSELNDNFDLGD